MVLAITAQPHRVGRPARWLAVRGRRAARRPLPVRREPAAVAAGYRRAARDGRRAWARTTTTSRPGCRRPGTCCATRSRSRSRRSGSAWAASCSPPRSAAGRTGGRGPGVRAGAGGQAGRQRRATRCSARCRSPRTCCSGTGTRSPRCRPARRCWPPPPATPNQAFRVGDGGVGAAVPHRDDPGDGARPGPRSDRERLAAEGWDVDAALARWDLDMLHADLEEVWQPFAARFAELLRRAVAAPEVPAPRAGGRPGAPPGP